MTLLLRRVPVEHVMCMQQTTNRVWLVNFECVQWAHDGLGPIPLTAHSSQDNTAKQFPNAMTAPIAPCAKFCSDHSISIWTYQYPFSIYGWVQMYNVTNATSSLFGWNGAQLQRENRPTPISVVTMCCVIWLSSNSQPCVSTVAAVMSCTFLAPTLVYITSDVSIDIMDIIDNWELRWYQICCQWGYRML